MASKTYTLGYTFEGIHPEPPQPTEVTDVLTYSDLAGIAMPASSGGYTFSTKGESGSQYTFYCNTNSSYNAFYLTASGKMCVTQSKGKVKSISIQWESHTSTSSERSIEIYGSNTQYTSSRPDVTGSSGTLLGTLVYAKDPTQKQTFNVTGDYYYIFIKAVQAGSYISTIEVEWDLTDAPTEDYLVISSSFYPYLGDTALSALPSSFSMGDINATVPDTTNTSYTTTGAIKLGTNKSITFAPKTGYKMVKISGSLYANHQSYWRINNTTPSSNFPIYTLPSGTTSVEFKYVGSSTTSNSLGSVDIVYQVNS